MMGVGTDDPQPSLPAGQGYTAPEISCLAGMSAAGLLGSEIMPSTSISMLLDVRPSPDALEKEYLAELDRLNGEISELKSIVASKSQSEGACKTELENLKQELCSAVTSRVAMEEQFEGMVAELFQKSEEVSELETKIEMLEKHSTVVAGGGGAIKVEMERLQAVEAYLLNALAVSDNEVKVLRDRLELAEKTKAIALKTISTSIPGMGVEAESASLEKEYIARRNLEREQERKIVVNEVDRLRVKHKEFLEDLRKAEDDLREAKDDLRRAEENARKAEERENRWKQRESSAQSQLREEQFNKKRAWELTEIAEREANDLKHEIRRERDTAYEAIELKKMAWDKAEEWKTKAITAENTQEDQSRLIKRLTQTLDDIEAKLDDAKETAKKAQATAEKLQHECDQLRSEFKAKVGEFGQGVQELEATVGVVSQHLNRANLDLEASRAREAHLWSRFQSLEAELKAKQELYVQMVHTSRASMQDAEERAMKAKARAVAAEAQLAEVKCEAEPGLPKDGTSIKRKIIFMEAVNSAADTPAGDQTTSESAASVCVASSSLKREVEADLPADFSSVNKKIKCEESSEALNGASDTHAGVQTTSAYCSYDSAYTNFLYFAKMFITAKNGDTGKWELRIERAANEKMALDVLGKVMHPNAHKSFFKSFEVKMTNAADGKGRGKKKENTMELGRDGGGLTNDLLGKVFNGILGIKVRLPAKMQKKSLFADDGNHWALPLKNEEVSTEAEALYEAVGRLFLKSIVAGADLDADTPTLIPEALFNPCFVHFCFGRGITKSDAGNGIMSDEDVMDALESVVSADQFGLWSVEKLIENDATMDWATGDDADASTTVTYENHNMFRRHLLEQFVSKRSRAFDCMAKGFFLTVGEERHGYIPPLQFFSSKQLRKMLCGKEVKPELILSALTFVDGNDPREVGRGAGHPGDSWSADNMRETKGWLLEYISKLDAHQCEEFLSYCAAVLRIPYSRSDVGSGGFQISVVARGGSEPVDRLPSARTCFKKLSVPAYSSYDGLEKAFKVAFEHAGGYFGKE